MPGFVHADTSVEAVTKKELDLWARSKIMFSSHLCVKACGISPFMEPKQESAFSVVSGWEKNETDLL